MKTNINLSKLKRSVLKNTYSLGRTLGFSKNFISVLCYHSFSNSRDKYAVSLTDFKKQLKAIKQYARFISVEDLGAKNFRGWNVCLTIDDGYLDVRSIIPLVSNLKIPVTLFVLSESGKVNRKEINNNHRLLTIPQIRKLHKLGWTIGCHSATHADLSKLTDPQLVGEIINSKKTLEKKLGLKINYFAYPKGIVNKRILKFVKKAGYKLAFTTQPGTITSKSSPFLLPRTVVEKSRNIEDFPYFISETGMYLRLLMENLRIWKIIGMFN